jgi:hypothetical protein
MKTGRSKMMVSAIQFLLPLLLAFSAHAQDKGDFLQYHSKAGLPDGLF